MTLAIPRWWKNRAERSEHRRYADRRYRQHEDGSFSGPYKGAAFGRGDPPTTAPPTKRLESIRSQLLAQVRPKFDFVCTVPDCTEPHGEIDGVTPHD